MVRYDSTEPARAYDLYGVQSKRFASNCETEHDAIERNARSQKRWQDVLEKKHLNVEIKRKEMSDMLMKRFKKEKDSQRRLDEERATKQYYDGVRAEKMLVIRERKRTADER